MKHYSQMSEKECNRREALETSRDNLVSILKAIHEAEEYCQLEGIYLTGSLDEMKGVVNQAILQVEDQAIEEGM